MILSSIKTNKYITIPELSKEIKKSEPTIYRHLMSLIDRKIVARVGSRKKGFWDLI